MKTLNRWHALLAAIPLAGVAFAAVPAAAVPVAVAAGPHTVHIGARLAVSYTAPQGSLTLSR